MYRKKLKTIFHLLLPILVISCFSGEPRELVISDQNFILGQEGKEFKCNPPLTRTHNTASICFLIKENWTPEPPWKQIKLDEGKMVTIIVTVRCKNGNTYKANIIGAAGGSVNARFEPEIPKEEKIISVRLESSSDLTVTKVFWSDYDAE